MQSGDRLFGLFGNVLVLIDKRHQFVELSHAFWTVTPNSVARPRMAFASIVCCLTNSDRAACKARMPCC